VESNDSLTQPAPLPHDTATQTRVPPRWINTARAVWLIIAAAALIAFALGVPIAYQKALLMNPASLADLQRLGLPLNLPALILVGTDIFTILTFGGIAAFIVWQRSNDWMALVAAMLMLTLGIVYSSPVFDAPVPVLWSSFFVGLGEFTQVMFVFLFPTGRFVPRVVRWIVVPLLIWRVAMWAIWYMPMYHAAKITAEIYGHNEQFAWDIIPFILLLAIGIGFQVYRYRRVSSPTERQQAKIMLYGMAITLAVVGAWVLVFNVFPIFPEGSRSVFLTMGSRMFRQIALLAVPVALAIAMLRYRLWNIDFVINRSLVYGSLTLALAVVFFLSTLILQTVFRVMTGGQQSTIALAASTLVIGLVFTPARNGLRTFVDRRFYHINIDYRSKRAAPAAERASFAGGPLIGKVIGSYKILEPIGRGGMAEVYRGEHTEMGRPVAIKILPPDLADQTNYLHRFEREARTISSLHHSNIVQLIDYGSLDGVPYMVMEYLAGQSLSDLIRSRAPLSLDDTQCLIQDVAGALDYAHAQGVIHRDVKPSNVILQPITTAGAGESVPTRGERAVLTDFGIAKLIGGATHLTQTGFVGTFDYIAPEQIQNSPNVDGRADIYSLAVMAYQLLTGQLPFTGLSVGAVLIAHMQQPAPNIQTMRRDLSMMTAATIQRALEKDPQWRYPTAGEFANALG